MVGEKIEEISPSVLKLHEHHQKRKFILRPKRKSYLTAPDVNIAFSRRPKTNYDNIINAFATVFLGYFTELCKSKKCLVKIRADKANIQEKSKVNLWSQTFSTPSIPPSSRNTSSEFETEESDLDENKTMTSLPIARKESVSSTSRLSKRLSVDKLIQDDVTQIEKTLDTSCKYEKKDPYCSSSRSNDPINLEDEKSIEDVRDPDFFTKYKGSDLKVKVQFKNGNKYAGRISSFIMEGEGVYVDANGTKLQASFICGQAQGHGHIVWPNMGWYDGGIKDNLRDGKGICILYKIENEKVCYFGDWVKGQRSGKGMIIFGRDDWYDGEWKNDQMDGFGMRQYPTGTRYIGNWKAGVQHGRGTIVWANNDTYSGKWKKGQMSGKGSYTWRALKNQDFVCPMQNTYHGSWAKNQRHGLGRMLLACEAVISTVWYKNEKHGPGQIICRNGIIIESENLFRNDKLYYLGKPVRIPIWNDWYEDFLRQYQLDLIHDEPEQNRKPEGKGKKYLNNIPFVAPVETMPLWRFIELGVGQPITDLEGDVTLHFRDMDSPLMAFEEMWLRTVLVNRIPDIIHLYNHYATLGSERKPEFKPALLRFMLWQFCRDCGLEESCYTLTKLDKEAGFGTFPFDIVFTFEMISYLLLLTYELCIRKRKVNKQIPGRWGGAFDYFITNYALPGTQMKNKIKDFSKNIPLERLHTLFKTIGVPVTISKILNFFNFKDEKEGCDVILNKSDSIPKISQGSNIIYPDGQIVFEMSDEDLNRLKKEPNNDDTFTATIKALRCLENKSLKEIVTNICPKSKQHVFIDGDYELCFLEFCEFISSAIDYYEESLQFRKDTEIEPSSPKRNVTKAENVHHPHKGAERKTKGMINIEKIAKEKFAAKTKESTITEKDVAKTMNAPLSQENLPEEITTESSIQQAVVSVESSSELMGSREFYKQTHTTPDASTITAMSDLQITGSDKTFEAFTTESTTNKESYSSSESTSSRNIIDLQSTKKVCQIDTKINDDIDSQHRPIIGSGDNVPDASSMEVSLTSSVYQDYILSDSIWSATDSFVPSYKLLDTSGTEGFQIKKKIADKSESTDILASKETSTSSEIEDTYRRDNIELIPADKDSEKDDSDVKMIRITGCEEGCTCFCHAEEPQSDDSSFVTCESDSTTDTEGSKEIESNSSDADFELHEYLDQVADSEEIINLLFYKHLQGSKESKELFSKKEGENEREITESDEAETDNVKANDINFNSTDKWSKLYNYNLPKFHINLRALCKNMSFDISELKEILKTELKKIVTDEKTDPRNSNEGKSNKVDGEEIEDEHAIEEPEEEQFLETLEQKYIKKIDIRLAEEYQKSQGVIPRQRATEKNLLEEFRKTIIHLETGDYWDNILQTKICKCECKYCKGGNCNLKREDKSAVRRAKKTVTVEEEEFEFSSDSSVVFI